MRTNNDLSYFSLNNANKDTHQKLHSFKNLDTGWCYGEGVPISDAIVALACQLNDAAWSAGFHATDAFPGIDGGISLTLYQGEDFYEFILKHEGTITFIHERGNQEIEYLESIAAQTALALINNHMSLSWKTTYVLFTKSTTIHEKNDLVAQHLPGVTASRLSVKCVSLSPAYPLASTYKPTMLTHGSRVIHQSSGNFQADNSRQILYLNSKPPQPVMFATTTSKTYRSELRVA